MNEKELIVNWQTAANNKLFSKPFLVVFLIVFLLVGILGNVSAEEGELGDESWTVKTRIDRVFYFTHGTAVWGHEFGFFKDPNDCESDTLWLTFSSSEEKVKNFIGKEVVISLNVDGKDSRINLPMLSAGTMGFTHVMTFTNWSPEEQFMDALMRGRYVRVQIVEPKELEVFLDIKEDRFSLKDFAASRKEAESACRDNAPRKGKEGNDLALKAMLNR